MANPYLDENPYLNTPDSSNPPHPENLLQSVLSGIGQTVESANTGTVPTTAFRDNPLMQAAQKEGIGLNAQFANGAMFGIPSAIASTSGQKFPESSNPMANAGLSILGGVTGGPAKVSGALASGISNPLLRGAASGGGFGLLMPGGIGQRAVQGGAGALLGAPLEVAADAVSGLGGLAKGLKGRSAVQNGTEVQQGVRNAVMGKFLGRTKQFDEALSNLPETTHDITNEMSQMKKMADINPSVKEAIDNSPIAKKLLYGDESGVGKIVDEFGKPLSEQVADQSNKIVSTRDLQNLRNELGKNFDYTDPGHDWQLGKLLSDLRLNQAAPFPNEMGAIAKDYKDTINNFNVVKPYLRPGRLGASILKGFGGEGGAEVRQSLNYFLGNKGKEIENIYQAGETSKKVGDILGKGAVVGGGGYLVKKALGH